MERRKRIDRTGRPRPRHSGAPGKVARPEYWRWPLVRAYVPSPDAWRVSGYGAAGVVRRAPSGLYSSAFFSFSLWSVGIEMMWGDDEKPLEHIEEGLAAYGKLMPPVEEGPDVLVSRFVWGAYGLNAWGGVEWEAEKVARYLRMVPPLGGTRNWWYQQFVGENGLVPPKLWAYVQPLIRVADRAPRGKEPAVATFMTFHGGNSDAAVRALRARPEDFALDVGTTGSLPTFFWMRERRAEPGRKVQHGAIVVGHDTIMAHAATLSLASIMVGVIREALGPDLTLVDVSWRNPSTLGFDPPGKMIV